MCYLKEIDNSQKDGGKTKYKKGKRYVAHNNHFKEG